MKQLFVPGLQEDMKLVNEQLSLHLAPVSWDERVNHILTCVRSTEGKMIRPQILLLCGHYGSRYQTQQARLCEAAALVEMVHMASLIHDDIVDDSPTRRGMPTVQAEFGKDMAVYTGDLLLSRVMQVLFSHEMVAEGALFAETIAYMCTGEIGQYDCFFDARTTTERYMKNIYGKTAAIFELSCRLGCMLSGCDGAAMENLPMIGKKLGLLFQIRDDLLDFTLSPEVDGKPSHMDFREGILTLPVLYALENEVCRTSVMALMEKARQGAFDKTDEIHLNKMLHESGGMARARETARALADELHACVDKLPPNKNNTYFRGMIRKLSDIL